MRALSTCTCLAPLIASAAGCTTSGTGYGTLRNGAAISVNAPQLE